jgi:hypothetical protein
MLAVMRLLNRILEDIPDLPGRKRAVAEDSGV